MNKENPKFIFKGGGDDKDYATIMPAFVLLAREERAFWSNVMTFTEYLIDILSITGGLGIFLKVGRFAMAVSTGDSILLQGIKKGVNYGGASIFITSGVGRGLLKLTETRDTPLGRAISEVLFYLEMTAIVGYVGVGVHAFIQRSAQKALKYTDDIEKIYREVDELTKKNIDKFDNVTKTDELVAAEERLAAIWKLEEIAGDSIKKIFGNGIYGGRILSKLEIEEWAKILKRQYGTRLEKVDKFENPKVLAQFDASTNTIRYKNDVTQYIMLHESFHAQEMSLIGIKEYVKNAALRTVKEVDYTAENWIRLYQREKYVYDKIIENAKKHLLTMEELNHNFFNLDYYILKLEKLNIKIPK